MRSGLLNERLTVYTLTTTTDSYGANTTVLTSKGTYWCRVLHRQHDRSINDVDRIVYNPDIQFELRINIPITESDIIEYDSLKFVIKMIEKNHNQDKQTLHCERYEQ